LKLFQEWEEKRIKENGEVAKFKYDIFENSIRTFVNVTM
jgi:hypothetical protein